MVSSSNKWNKNHRDRMNEVERKYYKKHKDKISKKLKSFRKNNLEFVRARERRYYQNRKKSGKFDDKFKNKQREYQKRWRKTDVGKIKSLKDNGKRLKLMKKIKEIFTIQEWRNKLNLTEGICPKCKKFIGIEKLTIDHILPLSLAPEGFEYTIDDVQPLCQSCNSSKRNKYNYSRGDLHHVGILVKDFDKQIKLFERYGGKVIWKGIAKKYEAECIFIDVGNMLIELIKTTKKDNHLSRFLKKYGEGYHHIALAKKFNDGEEGALPNMKVKFLNPKETGNMLIEFVDFDE